MNHTTANIIHSIDAYYQQKELDCVLTEEGNLIYSTESLPYVLERLESKLDLVKKDIYRTSQNLDYYSHYGCDESTTLQLEDELYDLQKAEKSIIDEIHAIELGL